MLGVLGLAHVIQANLGFISHDLGGFGAFFGVNTSLLGTFSLPSTLQGGGG